MKSLLQYPTNKVATISDTIKITSTINIYLYILFLIDKNLCFEKYTSNNNVINNKLPIVNINPVIIISLLFIFLALSLGLVISTAVQTQVVAVLISGIGLMMPALILSGMIFPIDNMPMPLQWASSIVPARWYISAVKKVMIEGLGIAHIITELSVITGMVVLLIGASIANIKNRLS